MCTLFRYKKPRKIDSNGPFLSRRVVWPGKSTTPIYQDAWNFKFSNLYYCCLQLLCVHYSAIKRPNKSIGMVHFLSRRLVWPGNLPHRPHIFIGWKVYPLHSSTIRFIKRFRITLYSIIHYKHVTRGSFESNYQYCYYFNRYEVQWGTNQSIRMILPQLN